MTFASSGYSPIWEKVNQPEFAKENKKNSVSLSGQPGICTHSYPSVPDFMSLLSINESKHKPDFSVYIYIRV